MTLSVQNSAALQFTSSHSPLDFNLSIFDSSYFGVQGYNTIGISLDSSLLPNGQFTALWSPECGNDITALIYTKTTSVPESSTTLGLLVFGVAGSLLIKTRKKSVVVS